MAQGERKYAKTHEWVVDNGDGTVSVGISEHAQDALGDIVFVELPEVGQALTAGEEFGVVESVKAASDLYSPVSGEIVEVNNQLNDSPELINESPFEAGWILKLKPGDPAEMAALLDEAAYQKVAEADG